MAIKIGINGFGRIGRNFLRIAINDNDLDFVAINDITNAATLAHLFKYDSVHGIYDGKVSFEGEYMIINDKKIKVLSERDPANLPWKDLGVQLVVESTGLFRDRASASKHLDAGAERVIISAPAKEPDITIVLGVNEEDFDRDNHRIISNASCTTNCLAPVAKVILDNFGFKSGWMTTVHSYTNDQRILDLPHTDLRRARTAGLSIIPTTTGAAKATGLVLPQLKGKLDGIAMRVPTANVSVVDLVVNMEKNASEEEINQAFKKAAQGELKGYLEVSEEDIVSIDLNGNPHSAIVDLPFTRVIEGNVAKVLAWYDNEWGYSARIKDLIKYIYS
jgi:glyceraldehyde 3-phosphate dehydrogenase